MRSSYFSITRNRRCRKAGTSLAQKQGGFTILEVVIAFFLITAALGSLAILAAGQWSTSKDVDVLSRVENAVATDLGWLKTYAKYWRMTIGPHNNLTCSQVGFGTPCTAYQVSTNTISYDPGSNTCPDPNSNPVISDTALALAFMTDAGSTSARTIAPTRPFNITVNNSTVADQTLINSATDTGNPRLPNGTRLVRKVSLGKNLIYVTYNFTFTANDGQTPYRFVRNVAIRPEAESWCP